MNFAWTTEQQELYKRIRRFSVTEAGADFSDVGTWRRAAAEGLAGLPISPEYGGGGFDCLTTARALEAFGHGCPDGGFAFSLAAHLLACAVPIDRHGTVSQKAKYLPKLCSGEWIGANAITEPDSGSDAFSLRTRGTKTGDGFILNGEKMFITNAPLARVFVVYAQTNPGCGMFSLSSFIVDRDTPGLSIGPLADKTGLTTAQMASVRLDNCHVPASQLLGAEGAGAAIFHDSMGWERCCLFAIWIGAMERQLAEVVEQASARVQFGRPIGANQAVSHRIADMKLRLEGVRLLLYRACWERSEDLPSDLSTALAKLAVSEAFLQSSLDAVHIFGARGIMRDIGIERYVRDALPATIYSGTSEMQREMIARSIGLPGPGRA